MAKQVLNNLETMGAIRAKINSNFDDTYSQGSTEFITAGITGSTLPALTNNGDGTINIATCNASLYDNANYTGVPVNYTIAIINNLALVDGDLNYVHIDYNSGTPIYATTTNKDNLNSSNKIPIFSIYLEGATIHPIDFGNMGSGAMNKVLETLSRLNRFTRYTGLVISGNASRNVLLTTGIVYKAYVEPLTLDAVNTATDDFYQMSYNGSVWSQILGTTYNNTQYQDATGLTTLGNQKWTVNWMYRGVEEDAHIYSVLGEEYSDEDAARDSSEPSNLPILITSHCILVGRIIVKKSELANEGNIQSVFKETFTTSPISIHNNLSDLQKAGAGVEWGHVDDGIQKTPDGLLDITPDTIATTSYSYGTRVTTTEMNALTGMTDGAEVYNLTTHSKHTYNGSEWVNNTVLQQITLFAKVGVFDFSATNVLNRKWYFIDGTTSTAERPVKTLTRAGRVILEGDFINSVGVELNDNDTNTLYRGDLKDFKYLNYYLRLMDCTEMTGDLSDLPNLTEHLGLSKCSLITGDLADLPNLKSYLSLTDCSLITGDLADLSNLNNSLNLTNCVNATGAYVNVSGDDVPFVSILSNTAMSSTDMDATLEAYEACTKDNGDFIATGMTRTTASNTAVTNLEARGWTITGISVV